jgi:hypothetical protein
MKTLELETLLLKLYRLELNHAYRFYNKSNNAYSNITILLYKFS